MVKFGRCTTDEKIITNIKCVQKQHCSLTCFLCLSLSAMFCLRVSECLLAMSFMHWKISDWFIILICWKVSLQFDKHEFLVKYFVVQFNYYYFLVMISLHSECDKNVNSNSVRRSKWAKFIQIFWNVNILST